MSHESNPPVVLSASRLDEIPANAVRLTEREALEKSWKMIYEWQPTSDVWPFRYGSSALAFLSGATGFFLASHFRRKLKLLHYGRAFTFIPCILVPALLAPITHQKFVCEPIFLQKPPCPVCIQLRGITGQTAVGVIYPFVLAPLSAFMFSSIHATYPLPLLQSGNVKELYSIWQKMSRPISHKVLALWGLQILTVVMLTNSEATSFFKLRAKVLAQQKQTIVHKRIIP